MSRRMRLAHLLEDDGFLFARYVRDRGDVIAQRACSFSSSTSSRWKSAAASKFL